jgi:flagellar basal body-associated protein FliL
MIKKRILAILLVLLVFLLAGCIKSTISVNVNPDGSGTSKIIMGLSKQYQAMVEQEGTSVKDMFSEASNEFTAQGYTVADYSDDKYVGVALTKEFQNLNDAGLEGLDITVSDTEPKTVKINGTVDTSSELQSQGQDPATLASMGDLEMSFEITLPGPASTHNATSVTGNTYKWDLLQQQNIQLEATLSGASSTNWLLIGGIVGGVLIIAIIVIIIMLAGRKKKAQMAQEQYAQQYQPVTPVQPAQPEPTTEPEPEPAPAPEPEPEPAPTPEPEPEPAPAPEETESGNGTEQADDKQE